MANNKMIDLRNHLFEELDRLKEATPAELRQESDRARAMIGVASTILETAKVELQYMELLESAGTGFVPSKDGVDQEEKKIPLASPSGT